MVKELVLLGALALSAMASPALGSPTSSAEASAVLPPFPDLARPERRLSALRLEVLQRLRNPGTARFRNEILGRAADSRSYALCGWVDAEDQTGQRGGFVAFVATEDDLVLYQGADAYGSFRHLWRFHCSRSNSPDEDGPSDAARPVAAIPPELAKSAAVDP